MEESTYAIHYLGKTYNTTIHKDFRTILYELTFLEDKHYNYTYIIEGGEII